jgi:hypothetical protein
MLSLDIQTLALRSSIAAEKPKGSIEVPLLPSWSFEFCKQIYGVHEHGHLDLELRIRAYHCLCCVPVAVLFLMSVSKETKMVATGFILDLDIIQASWQ